MVFINALDDPVVPEVLLNPIKEHAGEYSIRTCRSDIKIKMY